LAGTVRNRPDGAVAVMCAGDPQAIACFERALRRGPVTARVDALESIECTLPSGVSEFTILE
jgi:acylphosphatase